MIPLIVFPPLLLQHVKYGGLIFNLTCKSALRGFLLGLVARHISIFPRKSILRCLPVLYAYLHNDIPRLRS